MDTYKCSNNIKICMGMIKTKIIDYLQAGKWDKEEVLRDFNSIFNFFIINKKGKY